MKFIFCFGILIGFLLVSLLMLFYYMITKLIHSTNTHVNLVENKSKNE